MAGRIPPAKQEVGELCGDGVGRLEENSRVRVQLVSQVLEAA
jgi:hypothetical protein